MRKLTFCFAAACLFAPLVAQAATFNSFPAWTAAVGSHTLIDFEDFAAGTVITNQYASRVPAGVLFSSTAPVSIADAASVSAQTGGVPVSGTRVLDVGGASTDALIARFVETGTNTPTSVRAAGGWMIDIGTFGGGTVQFYDLGNNLIDSIVFAPATEGNVFYGAVNPAGISRITFDGVQAAEFVMIDDLVFSNIPEPATAVSALIAVLALNFKRRRRAL